MTISYNDAITHAYVDVKSIRKKLDDYIEKYRELFNSETEDEIMAAKKSIKKCEDDLLIEIHVTLG